MKEDIIRDNALEISGASLAISFVILAGSYFINPKPVQREYISPNRIELNSTDLNKDGKLETILRIDTTNYLLMKKNNEPVLSKYQLISKDTIIIN